MRGRCDGNDCRPGCLRLVFGGSGNGSRWLSASTSALLTPGSSSNNSSCASESFSLPGPYFAMRCDRRRSSSTRIFNSAYCNAALRIEFCFSCSMRSACGRKRGVRVVEGLEVALTMRTE